MNEMGEKCRKNLNFFGKFFKMNGGKFFKINGTIYIPVFESVIHLAPETKQSN